MSKRPPTYASSSKQPSTKKAKQSTLSGFFGSKTSLAATDDTDTTSSSALSEYKIFCDLDGVLVDFDAGVKKLFNGRSPDELPNQGMMWGAIGRVDDFYANLPWTSDGKKLWYKLKTHTTNTDILTGVSRTIKHRAEKFAWCQRELGIIVNHVDMAGKKSAHEPVTGRRKNKEGVTNVITCWSRNKHCESKANHILIDDRLSLKEKWEERGGIFVHHTSTDKTLTILREKGILLGEEEDKKNVSGKSEES